MSVAEKFSELKERIEQLGVALRCCLADLAVGH